MSKLLGVTLLVLLALQNIHAEIIIDQESDSHIQLADIALYVTKRYISSVTNTVIIMEKCKYCKKHEHNFHSRFLEHFLRNINATLTLQLLYAEPDDRPWDYNIFVVDTTSAFEELVSFPNTTHERQFFFFIILTLKGDNIYLNYVMLQILEKCRMFNVNDVVIMNDQMDGIARFYSYQLFAPDHCQHIFQAYEFNHFRNGTLAKDILFPQRLHNNLYNCTLQVSANVYYPLLNFQGDPQNLSHTRDLSRLSGIEGDILKILAVILNFQIKLNIPGVRSFIGGYENSTGCFEELQNCTADIAIGGFGSSDIHRDTFSASEVYHQTPFVFVVRSDLQLGHLKQLANPLCFQVWMMIALTLLIAFTVIKLIYIYGASKVRSFVFGPNNHDAHLNLFGILLGNPLARLPRRNFARFLLMLWMLSTLVLRSAYQGKMFDSLRVARRIPIPRSINELIERKYTLLTNVYTDCYYYPENMTTFMSHPESRYAVEQSTSELYTYTLLLDALLYHNAFNWNTSRLTYVDETIYTYQVVMFFRKHSVLKYIFDRKLKELTSAGITSNVARQHVKKEFQIINKSIQTLPSINNHMLAGIYVIYVTLNFIAVLIFALELYSKKSKKLQNIFGKIHC